MAVEQAVNAPRERDIGGAIVTPVAGALKRAKLVEFRFPIAQDMLRHAQFGAQFADRPERIGSLVADCHREFSGRSGRA